jgi:hypothetical protein
MRAGDMYICEGVLNRGAPEAADSEMVDKSQDAQTPADKLSSKKVFGPASCVLEIGYIERAERPCEGIRRRLTREHEHG